MSPTAPRKVTLLLVSASLAGATALSACGGSGDSSSTTAAAAPPAATATSTPTPGAQSTTGQAPVNAKIAGFAFAPQEIRVKVGQSVTWTNDDSAPHTVSAQPGAGPASGTLAQGAKYTWKATKAGTISYICTIHPSMTGKIVVE